MFKLLMKALSVLMLFIGFVSILLCSILPRHAGSYGRLLCWITVSGAALSLIFAVLTKWNGPDGSNS